MKHICAFLLVAVGFVSNFAFASGLKIEHVKPGFYSNGKCTVGVLTGLSGTDFRIIPSGNDSDTACTKGGTEDCGTTSIPINPLLLKDGNQQDMHGKTGDQFREKSFKKNPDGSIEVEFESTTAVLKLKKTRHALMKVKINPQGEITEVTGTYESAYSLTEGLTTRNRVTERCKNLKKEPSAAPGFGGGAAPLEKGEAGR